MVIFITCIFFIHLDQKPILNQMKTYVIIKFFLEENMILEFNQYLRSVKSVKSPMVSSIIHADLEFLI